MPSYVTLLRSNFIPIRRDDADGIKFVVPTQDQQYREAKLDDIINAFEAFKNSTEIQKKELFNALQDVIERHKTK